MIPNSPLVLQNDPTTLFVSSGMQALIPYLLGEVHPDGKRLVNVQNCIRTQDIEEIGDNRHTTFFRMIGNWSLGDYFKKEQLPWFFEYLTSSETGLGLDPNKLYVTVSAGDPGSKVTTTKGLEVDLGLDADSIAIWSDLFEKKGVSPIFADMTNPKTSPTEIASARIFAYDVKKNWWSRAGVPANMPVGEPGGPDSEVFYDFGTSHDTTFGQHCHPNCDCGRFMEIGNSVFMQYIKQEDGSFKELPQKNVDFGGGFERLIAAVHNNPDVFTTELYQPVISEIENQSGKKYADDKKSMRIIADHMKAATFLMKDDVLPSNKEQGYILRRLLRRAAVKMQKLAGSLDPKGLQQVALAVLESEQDIDTRIDLKNDSENILPVIADELGKFAKSIAKGLKEVEKHSDNLNSIAFDLFQNHGFPFEILQELAAEKGKTLSKDKFDEQMKKHRDLSRTASAGKFRGGLADHSEQTIKGHTATHLLHQALRDVLGDHVHQRGSNITSERVRFDFNYENRLTDEQIEKVETIVNEKIKQDLPVHFELIPTEDAHKMGAIGLFMDTYGEKSKIYFIGPPSASGLKREDAYSIEFCGGPHVESTGVLKSFKIQKQENLGKNQKRLYGVVG